MTLRPEITRFANEVVQVAAMQLQTHQNALVDALIELVRYKWWALAAGLIIMQT